MTSRHSLAREAIPTLIEECIPQSFGDLQRVSQWAQEFVSSHARVRGHLSIEIGTHRGGTAMVLLSLLEIMYPAPMRPPLFTIDPYGFKPYDGGDGPPQPLYGDQDKITAAVILGAYAHHSHYGMTSDTFFEKFSFGGYWWRGRLERIEDLAFVLIDGDHNHESILRDASAAKRLLRYGGTIIIDNIDNDPKTVPMLQELFSPMRWTLKHHESQELKGQQWFVAIREDNFSKG